MDQFAQQLATPNSDLRTLIRQNLDLGALKGLNPPLPVPPLAGRQPDKIRNAIQQLIQNQQPELAAAIRVGAQARADQLKAQLATQIASRLTKALNQSFSLYENWFDPFIGLRGRYNLTKALYLTAETDVGGFGIGSEITCQAYGALGLQITAISIPKSDTDTFIWTTTPRVSFFRLHCMVPRSPPESAFDAWPA